jgi:hypothetical protein
MDTRFGSGDVTETLVKATEMVSDFDPTHVMVVLYHAPKDAKQYKIRCVCSDEITIETANWMLDKMKNFLIRE